MSAPLVISASMLAVLLLLIYPHRLNVFERAFVWMAFSFIDVHFIFLVVLNLQWVKLVEENGASFAYHAVNLLLFPSVGTLLFSIMVTKKTWLGKSILCAVSVLVLSAIQASLMWAGIFEYVKWNVWKDMLYWLILFLLVAIPFAWFRKTMRKELGPTSW